MNKREVIQTLCEQNGLSKAETTRIVSIFFEKMSAALERGDRVHFMKQNIQTMYQYLL